MTSIYSDLFLNSFIASLVFSLQNESTLANMVSFKELYNLYIVFAIAMLASFAAHSINWSIGRLVMQDRAINDSMRPGYTKLCSFVKKYLSWGLLFCWIDAYGPFFLLIAGIFRVPYRYALPIAMAGKAAYYIYALRTGDVTVQF